MRTISWDPVAEAKPPKTDGPWGLLISGGFPFPQIRSDITTQYKRNATEFAEAIAEASAGSEEIESPASQSKAIRFRWEAKISSRQQMAPQRGPMRSMTPRLAHASRSRKRSSTFARILGQRQLRRRRDAAKSLRMELALFQRLDPSDNTDFGE